MSETWEEAILRIVRAKNGEIELQEIYREMEGHPLVTPYQKKPWKNGQPRYQNAIRSRLAKLKERGAVRQPHERNNRVRRGIYVSN